MTIQEAIRGALKTGGRIARYGNHDVLLNPRDEERLFHLIVEDILADDWIFEDEKIEITRGQLHRALDDLKKFTAWDYIELDKILGFK